MRLVTPRTYLIGQTTLHHPGLQAFLEDTDNEEFLDRMATARKDGLSEAEMLASFYAKLCYKSLTAGKNAAVTKVREIRPNIENCFDQGHGSVFEHSWFNFVTVNCSRVFTHELVRHRVGVAYSQESGRFCRPVDGQVDFVETELLQTDDEVFTKIRSVIAEVGGQIEYAYQTLEELVADKLTSQESKKKFTSFLRRILPNGMANIMGWSANIRQLRHMLIMRTSPHAEEEIRQVFAQVYDILNTFAPTSLYGMEAVDVPGSAYPCIQYSQKTD